MDFSVVRRRLSEIVGECPSAALPDLIGELSRAEAIASVRLHENGRAEERPAPDIRLEGKLIDAAAAAELLGITIRSLYRRADRLPFTRRLSPRTLRFDEAHLRRWLETRK